ncbi:MAG: hypothetical protein ACRD43_00455 [Pyrinomonadaceae bacterium]
MLKTNKTNLIPLLVLLFVILGCGGQNSSSTSNSAPASNEISSITWADYDKIYGSDAKTTDMQKEQSWKDFQGKRVAWSGEVAEVSNGTFGGLEVSVKMDKATLVSDISLELKKEYEDAASKLTKGSKIKFAGTLKSYGGAFLPATLTDGEIK